MGAKRLIEDDFTSPGREPDAAGARSAPINEGVPAAPLGNMFDPGPEDATETLSRIIGAHPRAAPHKLDSGKWTGNRDDGQPVTAGSLKALETALDAP